ncbi:MAG TPA: GatB/YqeY domain-containing protein [Streptosporangiaceae bacterium]|nr:GatB/YqeY domain-containing protein [Streptosporangiaceae bacterium]
MSELKERIRADLTASMKDRDEVRTRTLRMVLTEISKEEVSGSAAHELDDAEIQRVLTREAKRRREAADAFHGAGRADQAAAERAEGEVLAAYLPAQLDDAELTALVTAAITESGATGPGAMGQVMKAVNPKVAGRADGSRVAAEVRRQLTAT